MTYTIPAHESGDTFEGITFTVEVNGVALDLLGATILATFILQTNKRIIHTLNSGAGGGLTIVDSSPASGIFYLDKQIINWRSGVYDYEIKFTLADGTVKTYIVGTWEITNWHG